MLVTVAVMAPLTISESMPRVLKSTPCKLNQVSIQLATPPARPPMAKRDRPMEGFCCCVD